MTFNIKGNIFLIMDINCSEIIWTLITALDKISKPNGIHKQQVTFEVYFSVTLKKTNNKSTYV